MELQPQTFKRLLFTSSIFALSTIGNSFAAGLPGIVTAVVAAINSLSGNSLMTDVHDTIRPTRDPEARRWNNDILRASVLAVSDIIRNETKSLKNITETGYKDLELLAKRVESHYDEVDDHEPPAVVSEKEIRESMETGDDFRRKSSESPEVWSAFLHTIIRQLPILTISQNVIDVLGKAIHARFYNQLFQVLKFDFNSAESPLKGHAYSAITLKLLMQISKGNAEVRKSLGRALPLLEKLSKESRSLKDNQRQFGAVLEEMLALLKAGFSDLRQKKSSNPRKYRRKPSMLAEESALQLFGRDEIIQKGIEALSKSRLVTIFGPAGFGKTSVVLRIAHEVKSDWTNYRIYYFDLNYNYSADLIVNQLCDFFEFDDDSHNSQEKFGDNLKKLGKAVIVLDNFEQVSFTPNSRTAEELANITIGIWLKYAKNIRFLVGSRQELLLTYSNEIAIHLEPLNSPTKKQSLELSPDKLRSFDAFKVFESRTARNNPSFRPYSDTEVRQISEILYTTGGIPAPIELAVSNIRNLGLTAFTGEIKKTMFEPPSGINENIARKYLNYQLQMLFNSLSKLEKLCVLQAAQFRNGFDFDAASQTILSSTAEPISKLDLANAISRLLYLGILTKRELINESDVKLRYGFYLPYEQWLEEQWNLDNTVPSSLKDSFLQRKHDYFCNLFEDLNKRNDGLVHLLQTPDFISLDRLNLVESHLNACQRKWQAQALCSITILIPSLVLHGPASLMEELIERTLYTGQYSPEEHALLLTHLRDCLFTLGKYAKMETVAHQSVLLAEKTADSQLKMRCNFGYEYALSLTKGKTGTRATWEANIEQSLKTNNILEYCVASKCLASLYDWSGLPATAIEVIDNSMAVVGSIAVAGSKEYNGKGQLINMRGIIGWHDGRIQESLHDLCTGFWIFRKTPSDSMWVAGALTNLGLLSTDLKRFQSAHRLLARAKRMHTQDEWRAVNEVAIARLYLHEGKYKEAFEYCKTIQPSVEQRAYYENKALLRSVHAVALYAMGNLEAAESKLSEALEMMRPSSIKMRRYFVTLVTAAYCAADLGKYEESRQFLEEAAQIAQFRKIDSEYKVDYYKDSYLKMKHLQETLTSCEMLSTYGLTTSQIVALRNHQASLTDSGFDYPWYTLEKFLRAQHHEDIYLVGYGSLLNPQSAAGTLRDTPTIGHPPVVSLGARRIFNYKIPETILGKYNVPENPLEIAALNAEPLKGGVINGRLIRISIADLDDLRIRETAYDLRPVSCIMWDDKESTPFTAYVLCCAQEYWNGSRYLDNSLLPHREYSKLCCTGAELVSSTFLQLYLQTCFLADGVTIAEQSIDDL